MGCYSCGQSDQGRSCLSWQSGQKAKLPEMTEWPAVKLLLRVQHPKVEASHLDLEGPRSFFRGCVTACAVTLAPRHQFLAEMPEAKVS